MQIYQLGDVVLIRFPYTNATQSKKRPALVLADTQDGDILVCRITSKSKGTNYDVEIQDWQQAGLKVSSTARLHKIATLEKALIAVHLGRLTHNDLLTIKKKVKDVMKSV